MYYCYAKLIDGAESSGFTATLSMACLWHPNATVPWLWVWRCLCCCEQLAKRMWNCDETAFATDTASKKILARRGAKQVHVVGDNSGSEYITVLGCGSASGEHLPPYIVYKGKNLWTTWTKGGSAGALYTCRSRGGWSNPTSLSGSGRSSCLLCPPSCRKVRSSLIDLELIALAKEREVILFCMPSHTTHALQPEGSWPFEQAVRGILSGPPSEGRLSQGWIMPHLKSGYPEIQLCHLPTHTQPSQKPVSHKSQCLTQEMWYTLMLCIYKL